MVHNARLEEQAVKAQLAALAGIAPGTPSVPGGGGGGGDGGDGGASSANISEILRRLNEAEAYIESLKDKPPLTDDDLVTLRTQCEKCDGLDQRINNMKSTIVDETNVRQIIRSLSTSEFPADLTAKLNELERKEINPLEVRKIVQAMENLPSSRVSVMGNEINALKEYTKVGGKLQERITEVLRTAKETADKSVAALKSELQGEILKEATAEKIAALEGRLKIAEQLVAKLTTQTPAQSPVQPTAQAAAQAAAPAPAQVQQQAPAPAPAPVPGPPPAQVQQQAPGDEYTITVTNDEIEDGEYGFEYSNGSWRVLFGPDDDSKEAMVYEMIDQKQMKKLREDAQYVVGSKDGITVTMKPTPQRPQPQQRMFSINADEGGVQEYQAIVGSLDTETVERFKKFKCWQDFANGARKGTVKKYEAMVDRGLVGAKGQVMGGFFVADEAKMRGDEAAAYARKAAGTTIRLLTSMLSCTVGNAVVTDPNLTDEVIKVKLGNTVEAIKTRVAGVKGADNVKVKLDKLFKSIKEAVEKPNFIDETLFDHAKAKTDDDYKQKGPTDPSAASGSNGAGISFVAQQIENLEISAVNAADFVRAFNAITSFVMTARDDDANDGVDMLTTAAEIVWQFQKVRRMVQIEALKKQRESNKEGISGLNSTEHLSDNALPIRSGSAYVGGGGKCGGGSGGRGGLSSSFVQRMFEMYVK